MKDNSSFEDKQPVVAKSRRVMVFDVSHSYSDAFSNSLLTVLILKIDRCYFCKVYSLLSMCSCVFERHKKASNQLRGCGSPDSNYRTL